MGSDCYLGGLQTKTGHSVGCRLYFLDWLKHIGILAVILLLLVLSPATLGRVMWP